MSHGHTEYLNGHSREYYFNFHEGSRPVGFGDLFKIYHTVIRLNLEVDRVGPVRRPAASVEHVTRTSSSCSPLDPNRLDSVTCLYIGNYLHIMESRLQHSSNTRLQLVASSVTWRPCLWIVDYLDAHTPDDKHGSLVVRCTARQVEVVERPRCSRHSRAGVAILDLENVPHLLLEPHPFQLCRAARQSN